MKPTEAGIGPVRELELRSKTVRSVQAERSGIGPVRLEPDTVREERGEGGAEG